MYDLTQAPFKLVHWNFPRVLCVQSCKPPSKPLFSRSKRRHEKLLLKPNIRKFFSKDNPKIVPGPMAKLSKDSVSAIFSEIFGIFQWIPISTIPLFFSGFPKLPCHVCHKFFMVDKTIASPVLKTFHEAIIDQNLTCPILLWSHETRPRCGGG